ncbi:hypothetical protein [Candidatus Clavichlamydia salmonicola]|nr:hypothetical protein [Candidatus Clavichlamydia salmonicola]
MIEALIYILLPPYDPIDNSSKQEVMLSVVLYWTSAAFRLLSNYSFE